MASLGGAGESVAVAAGAGELGGVTATLLAGAGFTVMAADRTPKALDELPEGIRREAGDTTDQAVAKTLIDPTAGLAAYGLGKAAAVTAPSRSNRPDWRAGSLSTRGAAWARTRPIGALTISVQRQEA
jgi:nucleoside-diphosphate-sugar epimerase